MMNHKKEFSMNVGLPSILLIFVVLCQFLQCLPFRIRREKEFSVPVEHLNVAANMLHRIHCHHPFGLSDSILPFL